MQGQLEELKTSATRQAADLESRLAAARTAAQVAEDRMEVLSRDLEEARNTTKVPDYPQRYHHVSIGGHYIQHC